MSPTGEGQVVQGGDSSEEEYGEDLRSPAAKRSADHFDDDSSVEYVEQSEQPGSSPAKRFKVDDGNGGGGEEEGDYIIDL